MSTTVTIIENGPAIVDVGKEGILYLKVGDKKESAMLSQKIAFCRCGLSEAGMFCDGSHKNKVK